MEFKLNFYRAHPSLKYVISGVKYDVLFMQLRPLQIKLMLVQKFVWLKLYFVS